MSSTQRARLAALVIVMALIGGALALAKQPLSAYGSGVTNRACIEGRCTTTTLVSNGNPSTVGQAVTYTATVAPPTRGFGTPTGTVAFHDGGITISGCGARPLSTAGIATCTTTYQSPDTHQISATYSGDGTFTSSTADLPTQTVTKIGVSFLAAASPTTAPDGSTVTLSASGLPSGATGTVTFSDASHTMLCTTPTLMAGSASCSTAALPPGGYAVTATYLGDGNYQSATATTSFTVSAPPAPSASIISPPDGATFTRLQSVAASFGCQDGAGAPGVAICAGTVTNGSPIDTSKVGPHQFKVGAASKDGQVTVKTVNYRVEYPDNRFSVTDIVTQHDGVVRFDISLPGPGTIDVLESAWISNEASAAALLKPGRNRFAFARHHDHAAHPGTIHVRIMPNARGMNLVTHHRYKVKIRLWVSYTPHGGLQRNFGRRALRITR